MLSDAEGAEVSYSDSSHRDRVESSGPLSPNARVLVGIALIDFGGEHSELRADEITLGVGF
jgi:hypothetical protein